MKTLGALLVLGVLLATLAPRRTAPGKLWLLLRALFPSWRFFEDVGTSGVLLYRVGTPNLRETDPWLSLSTSVPRGGFQLLHNPQGNLRFAEQSLIDQVLLEVESLPPSHTAETLIPYQLLQRLVERSALGTITSASKEAEFELKILAEEANGQTPHEILFASQRWKAMRLGAPQT